MWAIRPRFSNSFKNGTSTLVSEAEVQHLHYIALFKYGATKDWSINSLGQNLMDEIMLTLHELRIK